MFHNPFAHAHAVRERASRYEREAAVARLLSAPRPSRPGPGVDSEPPGPAVTASAAGAGPPP